MSISLFDQPPQTWRPYTPALPSLARKPLPNPRTDQDWEDLAADEDWSGAILGFLRENWRGKHLTWHVINAVVAESRPEARWLTRKATREALTAMMQLIREKRVLRYRRRWVVALEFPPEIQPVSSISGQSIPERRPMEFRLGHIRFCN